MLKLVVPVDSLKWNDQAVIYHNPKYELTHTFCVASQGVEKQIAIFSMTILEEWDSQERINYNCQIEYDDGKIRFANTYAALSFDAALLGLLREIGFDVSEYIPTQHYAAGERLRVALQEICKLIQPDNDDVFIITDIFRTYI